jgi:hypothetical protein
MQTFKRYTTVLTLLLSMLWGGNALAEEVLLELETGKYVIEGETVRIPVLATAVDADRSIAGAAFSVDFDDGALDFLGAESSFFGTFASYSIDPGTVNVDGTDYTSPLVTNSPATGLAMIAAARPTPGVIPAGSTAVLFELIFEAGPDAFGNYDITLHSSTIDNVDAGYDAAGEEIAALINAESGAGGELVFTDVTVEFGAAVALAVYDTEDRDGDGLLNGEEIAAGTDPDNPDTDGDGRTDFEELNDTVTSDPLLADSDGDGTLDGHEVFTGYSPTDPSSTPPFVYEQNFGPVSTAGWTTVNLPAGIFFDPVVIATPAEMSDGDATFIQLRNISGTSFEIRLRDASGGASDAEHIENVHSFVTERGRFILENGAKLIADRADSKAQTKAGVKQKYGFNIPKSFKLRKNPAVFASVTSVNDTVNPVAIRIDRPGKKGFSYFMQEEQAKEATNPGHGSEQFNFVAVEPFMGIVGDNAIEVGVKVKAATHEEKLLPSRLYADISVPATGILANLQSMKEKDPAILRLRTHIDEGVVFQIVEDQSLDALRLEHKAETVAYMFFTAIAGSPNSDGDTLTDIEEYLGTHTDLNSADTDGDGLLDSEEGLTGTGTDPLKWDSDGDGFSDGQEVFALTNGDTGADPNDGDKQPGIHFEIVRIDTDSWTDTDGQSFAIDGQFWDPVVVAGPLGQEDLTPAFIQIYDVQQDSFSIRLTNAGAGGAHVPETLHYLVMDRGHYAMSNGKRIFAGKLDSRVQTQANKFEKVKFIKKFFRETPVVLASTNSVNDPEPASVRLDKVKKTEFSFTLQEDSLNQASSPGHPSEEISFIAVEPFTDIFGEAPPPGENSTQIILEIGSRGKAFDDDDTDYPGDGTLAFSKAHTETPLFLANMQTAYDKDSARLRFNSNIIGSDRFIELFVQEDDAAGDGDTVHSKPETVGYLASSPIDMTDTDGDGVENDYELFIHKTDPNVADTDGDGLEDGYELDPLHLTDPLKWDSDGDGAGDGHEDGAGTDPMLATDVPELFFEVQEMTIDGVWGEISFNHNFYDPIIVATSSAAEMIQDGNTSMPSAMNPEIVQIRKFGSAWQIRSLPLRILGDDPATDGVEETDYVPESIERRVFVTIIERGVFTTPEGNVVIAGSDSYQQTRKNKLKKVKFPKTPKIKKTAAVFASVGSVKDEDNPIYHRLVKVGRTGFSYIFQEEEYNDQVHVIYEDGQPTQEGEILSYIVFGGAESSISGTTLANVHIEGSVVADDNFSYNVMVNKKLFGSVELTDPAPWTIVRQVPGDPDLVAFMMDMQSAYDKDPANVRYREVWHAGSNPDSTADMYIPFVSEDRSLDAETIHKPENMGSLRFYLIP